MYIWSKNLLIQTIPSVRNILAYASDEAIAASLAVGDSIKINDGMGISSYQYTAYPTSTSEIGNFTYDGTISEIEQIGDNTIYKTLFEVPTSKITFNINESNSTLTTYGDQENAEVTINVDQNNATIESSTSLETSLSLITGYRSCEFDSLNNYTVKLQCAGLQIPFNQQFLVRNNEIISYALVYNNKLVGYDNILANRDIVKKAHTINIIPDVQTATTKIYDAITSQIQAYSDQVISYEVSAQDYQTVTDTYTVPKYDINAKTYNINVHLSPISPDPSIHYTFDSNGNIIDCDSSIYLKATGTQYIDTGITTNDNNTINIIFKLVSGSEPTICGTYATGSTSRYSPNSVTWLSNNNYSRVLKSSNLKNITMSAGVHTLNYSSANVIYDGTTMSWESDSGNNYNNNLCLFTSRYGTAQYYGKLSLNRYKIWDSSNTLVRDLVPVPQGLVINSYTVPSNGMWDIVNQQFYSNQGSGNFEFEET